MQRLIDFFGLTIRDATEIAGFAAGFITSCVILGHIFAEAFISFLDFLGELLKLLFCKIVNHIRKELRK